MARSTASAPADAILPVGWPSRRLSRWPVPVDWRSEPPPKRVGPVGYHKVVGTVRALFNDTALAPVLARFQDYCFQQGAQSNANGRDRAFFFDVLTHDLVFFAGDQGRPIVDDLPIDPKVYDALPQMRGSHFDLWRIERRGIAGGVRLRSLLRDIEIKAGTRLLQGPGRGDVVVGRVVQIGRGFFLDDPLLAVPQRCVDDVVRGFHEELAATRTQRGADLTAESLLKVAGYHLYELAAGRMLQDDLATALGEAPGLAPVIVRHRLRTRRDLPDLSGLPGGKVVERDDAGRAVLVLVDLAPTSGLHTSVTQAMVSVEDRDVELVAFVEQGADALLAALAQRLPSNAIVQSEALGTLSLYRALRHTLRTK